MDASTQTGVCNSLNLLKQIKKQDAITQTTCYFQTTPTRRMFESFRASAEPLEGFDKESVLKFYNFSVPNVHRASQTDSPAKSSCMINTDSQTKPEKNTLTKYHVGLQANLPTEETLKYMEDLQVQKKVNMAIAELCFHLSKVNEENAEDEDENQKESETEEWRTWNSRRWRKTKGDIVSFTFETYCYGMLYLYSRREGRQWQDKYLMTTKVKLLIIFYTLFTFLQEIFRFIDFYLS